MRAAVIFGPPTGSIASVAEAIGRGFQRAGADVVVGSFDRFAPSDVVDLDLLAVGARTHGYRLEDGGDTDPEDEQRVFDGSLPEPDLADWLDDLPDGAGRAAVAFDTRRPGPKVLTGSAARSIEDKLEFGGFQIAQPAESFEVDDDDTALADGEEERAEAWAADLATVLAAVLGQE
jgi:flavodoxin